MAIKGHEGLMLTGQLAALAFHAEGVPRRARPSLSDLAARAAADTRARIESALTGLARRQAHARTPTARLGLAHRALRYNLLALRYQRHRIESHLTRLLRADPRAEACYDGTVAPNLITNSGEAFLVDAWQGTTELEVMKYHGCGTGATAAAETDTALGTESTTVITPDSTRATGSLTEASASVFRTVGTVSFDGSAAITEWGLFSQAATGGGTLWSRVVFSAISVAASDSVAFTYDLTVE